MNCKQCHSAGYEEPLFDGIYVCRVDGYKIENTSGDVILVIYETTFDSDDDEVGDNVNVKYSRKPRQLYVYSYINVLVSI